MDFEDIQMAACSRFEYFWARYGAASHSPIREVQTRKAVLLACRLALKHTPKAKGRK